ncbi:hypothetical protein EDD18DRAFT_1455949 [Armillaria luteobubalina]|uniref:Uncharacterized protein n=1 Tax=Armillaria luteobubalina TaxID=153913 RepID=A0AA39QQQ0_9AGAR|nr:hypothetical protein EDD18DRAFT_1455949 [Armillaria luteobubalina]
MDPPPADAIERAKTEGRKEGLFAGLIGAKFMGLNRNKTVVTIVLSGALSGYYFTEVRFHLPSATIANVHPPQAFTQTALKQLQVEWEKRQKEPSQGSGSEPPA